MTTNLHIESVRAYANRWRSLKAWRAPLTMDIGFAPWKGGRLGVAQSYHGTALVYCTGKLYIDLATALHEMAHLAAPNHAAHDREWREIFVAAAAEAFECDVDDFDIDVNYGDLDAQVEDAARVWLESR